MRWSGVPFFFLIFSRAQRGKPGWSRMEQRPRCPARAPGWNPRPTVPTPAWPRPASPTPALGGVLYSWKLGRERERCQAGTRVSGNAVCGAGTGSAVGLAALGAAPESKGCSKGERFWRGRWGSPGAQEQSQIGVLTLPGALQLFEWADLRIPNFSGGEPLCGRPCLVSVEQQSPWCPRAWLGWAGTKAGEESRG